MSILFQGFKTSKEYHALNMRDSQSLDQHHKEKDKIK